MTEAKSAQPQLPKRPVPFYYENYDDKNDIEYLYEKRDADVYMDALEAENKSLKSKLDFCGEILGKICVYGTLIQGEKPVDPPPHAAIDAILTQINRAEKAEAERDKALEVIREYRTSEDMHEYCIPSPGWDDRCPTCIKADALLSRETKEKA